MIPKAPGQRVKTNRLDAYKLGVQVRTGDLSFVHVPEKKYRDLRHLVRLRQTYRKRTIGVKNALKGLFLFEGITFPDGRWSKQLVRELEQTSHRPAVEFKIQRLLLDLQYFQAQELKTKAQIRRFCRADEEINRCIVHMMTVPGVGWIVSTYVLAALGGYKHLSSIKSTTGFVGLGPRENSTGDKVRRGEITAVGDPNVRKMIVQGAWVGIRKDPELRLTFDKVFYRNPIQYASKKAIIAVSRKMVGWMHVVLRDQRPFENRLKKTA
jgi:transposase